MSRIGKVFDSLGDEEGAYIPYVCTGDPDMEFSIKLVEVLCDSGADILELGIPFSDPVADGRLIQEAMNRSLVGGFRCGHLFEMIRSIREIGLEQPVVVMGYYNTMLQRGLGKFCNDLADVQGDGIIAVDLPMEECKELNGFMMERNLDLINLISPNTPFERRRRILDEARGYAYLVSVAGTTGLRDSLTGKTLEMIRTVSTESELPIALGFGISKPQQARKARDHGAKGVVEGSNLIRIYGSNLQNRRSALNDVEDHARLMKSALQMSGDAVIDE
ncbi:MAG: tryptophan synthase subunit alpha [Methanomassiliicoccales archaeon]|nr:tryptophan synthase subunit alpha [Methanomassiliicoccales archaeon]NYT15674.1 tryptophan synthase subunit alpha [Methanomassiliicoccales archaeon]